MDNDALKHSWTVQSQASALGFDWPDASGVLDKIEEELNEIREALSRSDTEHAQRELGDLLLASVNLARFLEIPPEVALQEATARFSGRFALLQAELARLGKPLSACTLAELDAVWAEVKQREQR